MARFCIDISKYDSRFHTIVSGPYTDLNSCYGPCGASDPAITTTSTTTTQSPSSVSSPLVNGRSILNLNDEASFIDIQYSSDAGTTWFPYNTIVLNANTGTNITIFDSQIILRARASLNGVVTGWSDSATYSNIDNIVAVTNGRVVTNPNNYNVYAIIQYSNDNGATWFPYTIMPLNANTTTNITIFDSQTIIRARFAKNGPGVSVSAWSIN